MNAPDITLDQRTRADYREAVQHLSARTVAELHRRRIGAVAARESRRGAGPWFGWPLAAALGSACALVIVLGLRWPPHTAAPEPVVVATLEALDALDAEEAINLTALDEDSDFFLWLAAHETRLLAME